MPGKLVFLVDDDLMKIVDHCSKEKCRIPYTDTISKDPGMWLVKDSGVYLMAATGGLPDSKPLVAEGGKKNVVVYAVGHNPDLDKDTWEHDREVCGGDDFVEFVPIGNLIGKAKKGMKLVINLTEKYVEIELFGKAEPARKDGKREGKAKAKAEADLLS